MENSTYYTRNAVTGYLRALAYAVGVNLTMEFSYDGLAAVQITDRVTGEMLVHMTCYSIELTAKHVRSVLQAISPLEAGKFYEKYEN